MTWEQRVRQGAYIAPSGRRIAFDFTSVSASTELRGTVFEFGNVDGAYVQRNGRGPRTLPIRCYFSGPECDVQADTFESMLFERGSGRLEHPLYGTMNVTPFGTVARSDDLVEAANQSVVEITFWPDAADFNPRSLVDAPSSVRAANARFIASAAEQFSSAVNLSSGSAQAYLGTSSRTAIDRIGASLDAASAATSAVQQQFRSALATALGNLDTLVGDPLALVNDVLELAQIPAEATSSIEARLDGYVALATQTMESVAGRPWLTIAPSVPMPARNTIVANDFHLSDVVACGAMSGAILASLSGGYTTRPQAMAAAFALAEQWAALDAWRSAGFAALVPSVPLAAAIDTGAAYRDLLEAYSLAVGSLIELSFSLKAEKRIRLDRDRTILDLASELYGGVDEFLDLLITSNNLTGSEILELPKGREIVYYP